MTVPPSGPPGSGSEPPEQPDEPQGNDPFGLAALLGPLGGGLSGGDPFAALAGLLSGGSSGPVNWELARQLAVAAVSADDPPVTAEQQRDVADTCRLADLWLDPVTALPGSASPGVAWTRTAWIDATLPAWQRLIDPVAAQVAIAMATALSKTFGADATDPDRLALPPGVPTELLGALGGDALKGVMAQVGGLVFGAQVGQALGALAGDVLASAEIGLPLSPPGQAALLLANVGAWGDGLEVPSGEVLLYLAVRDAAAQRLFAHVPWLRAHLFDAVEAYARGLELDVSAIESAMESVDPNDPESVQSALSGGLFTLTPTAAQQVALNRLETALALVDGWVDAVTDDAVRVNLPAAAALRETVRRRRASGGPAEQTFATLVGLTLRPRRLRDAATLWSALTEARGVAGRDAVWTHPDLLPGAEDLDDPLAFVARSNPAGSGTDWDAELRGLDET